MRRLFNSTNAQAPCGVDCLWYLEVDLDLCFLLIEAASKGRVRIIDTFAFSGAAAASR